MTANPPPITAPTTNDGRTQSAGVSVAPYSQVRTCAGLPEQHGSHASDESPGDERRDIAGSKTCDPARQTRQRQVRRTKRNDDGPAERRAVERADVQEAIADPPRGAGKANQSQESTDAQRQGSGSAA